MRTRRSPLPNFEHFGTPHCIATRYGADRSLNGPVDAFAALLWVLGAVQLTAASIPTKSVKPLTVRRDAGRRPAVLSDDTTKDAFDVTKREAPMALDPAPPPRKPRLWKSPVALGVAITLLIALCVVMGLVAFVLHKIGGAL